MKWTLEWEKPKEVIICGDWSIMGHYKKGKKRGASSSKEVELNAIDMALVMPDVSIEPDLLSIRSHGGYRISGELIFPLPLFPRSPSSPRKIERPTVISKNEPIT